LTYALSTRPDRHSPRQIRHLDFIAQFTTDIRFVEGSENAAADALSQIAINATTSQPALDFEEIALAQQSDPELRHLRENGTSLDFQTILLPSMSTLLVCDMSTGNPQPFVPEHFCRSVFDALRNLSHQGLCGPMSTLMSAGGLGHALDARERKYNVIPPLFSSRSQPQTHDSTTSTLTLWVPYLSVHPLA